MPPLSEGCEGLVLDDLVALGTTRAVVLQVAFLALNTVVFVKQGSSNLFFACGLEMKRVAYTSKVLRMKRSPP